MVSTEYLSPGGKIFVGFLLQQHMEQYVGILDLMMIRLPWQEKQNAASLVSCWVPLIGVPFAGVCLKKVSKTQDK